MNRNDRHPAISMSQVVVAALDPDYYEPASLERRHDMLASESWVPRHLETVTFWTPTKSRLSEPPPSTSRQTSMAS